MVVTRKTPNTPMPSASRTSSTQATPRISKGKAPLSSSLSQEIEAPLENGSEALNSSVTQADYSGPQFSDHAVFSDNISKINRATSKGRTRRKRSTSLLDIFARAFIFFFLVYSLSVCPYDKQLQSPVCRGLTEYRRLILEPYMLKPLHNMLQHPSIAPYTSTITSTAIPAINRTRKEWNSRVVPRWRKHVVPQWQKRVSPHIARLDARVAPYRQSIAAAYSKAVSPYIEYVNRYSQKAQPYIFITVVKTYNAYEASKPYLAFVSEGAKRIPPILSEYVVKPLAMSRRQFVDPHVALLVEKVKELSSGSGSGKAKKESHSNPSLYSSELEDANSNIKSLEAEPPLESELNQDSDELSSASSVVSESVMPSLEVTESVPGATYSPVPEQVLEPIVELGEVTPEEAVSEHPPADEVKSSEGDSEPKVVYVTETATAVETVVVKATSVVTEIAEAPHTPGTSESLTQSFTDVTTTPAVADITDDVVQSSVSFEPDVSSDFDFDEFIADLGLDGNSGLTPSSPSSSLSPEESASVPAQQVETEEERLERLRIKAEENAEKRRDIESRHTKWEEKLQVAVKEQKKALRKALVALRKSGVADLKSSQRIRTEIDTLHSESEKALRGTETYFGKLKKEDKEKDEKVRLWNRVLEKVEAKFAERSKSVDLIVSTWYQENVLAKEWEEVQKVATLIKSIAEDGQADIGLDYAWLDDVTYMDWQRYHALLDTYKEFVEQAQSIQNGTHPSPPIDPVMDALNDLESEVEDITVGFETRLRRIKREGERVFASDEPLDLEGDETSSSDDAEVSILPISGDGTAKGKPEDKVLQEVSDAILGRSGEEVVAALERAESVVAHEEL